MSKMELKIQNTDFEFFEIFPKTDRNTNNGINNSLKTILNKYIYIYIERERERERERETDDITHGDMVYMSCRITCDISYSTR